MTTSIDNTYLDIPVKRDGDYYYEMYDKDGDLIASGSLADISDKTKIKVDALRRSYEGETVKYLNDAEVIQVGKLRKIFKCYEGDRLVITGTVDDLMYELDIPLKTVANYIFNTKLGRYKKYKIYNTNKTILVTD